MTQPHRRARRRPGKGPIADRNLRLTVLAEGEMAAWLRQQAEERNCSAASVARHCIKKIMHYGMLLR